MAPARAPIFQMAHWERVELEVEHHVEGRSRLLGLEALVELPIIVGARPERLRLVVERLEHGLSARVLVDGLGVASEAEYVVERVEEAPLIATALLERRLTARRGDNGIDIGNEGVGIELLL